MGIRAKIGLPLAALTFVLGFACYWFIDQQLQDLNQKNLMQSMQAKALEVESAIAASAQMALEMAATTSALPEVAEAYALAASGDMADEKSPQAQQAREHLRRVLKPVLDGYQAATGQKLQLHYHLPNGRSLVRLWRDKQVKRNDQWVDVSDDLTSFRPTVLEVNRQGRPVKGIELGRGGFAIRGVTPVVDASGNRLGSVEVLADFGQVFKKSVSSASEAVLLYMNADKLGVAATLNDAGKYPVLDGRFVRVAAEGDLIKDFTPAMTQLEDGKRSVAVAVQQHMAVAAFPVNDYTGTQIGVMVYLRDVAEQDAIIAETGRILLAVLAALLVIPVVYVFFIVGRCVVRPVTLIRQKIQDIAENKADLKSRVDNTQNDEVGLLATWFNRLMTKIEETLCDVEGYKNLINAVPDPIFAVDDNYTILMANDATTKLLGCSQEELKKSTCASKFKTKVCGTPDCPIAHAKRTQGFWQADILDIGTSAKPHYIQPTGDLLKDCYGKVVGYVEVARNVTRLVEKENELSDKMRHLAEMNTELVRASEQIVDATDEMLQRFGQMTSNSDRQSHRVQETATAMEEMNATVLEVAQNASHAAEQAGDAKTKAEDGEAVVEQSVQAIAAVRTQAQALKQNMGELGQRAENIGQIMNVISDIADQTNLLALNAAIEAARAGDAGRGFAVVADEVRKLAEKTMHATKEVGEAIRAIQDGARKNAAVVDTASQAVDSATTLASQSGEALKAIVRRVVETTAQVQAIAAAAEEQSAASEEITRAIAEVNDINSATVADLQASDAMLVRLASLAGKLRSLASS
ncbi:methyl-accepting chemotaxis protein [Megalodesulfovibrio gigas]|uniref:methyl-accepting chemotaxis protein n=1 Tax=Megalodesulfovibrio gigas TaxID=879 RepID=UPI00048A1A4A|nr:methyl-accepting chemotaxis protein [Megalodesulfovibrio gigas]